MRKIDGHGMVSGTLQSQLVESVEPDEATTAIMSRIEDEPAVTIRAGIPARGPSTRQGVDEFTEDWQILANDDDWDEDEDDFDDFDDDDDDEYLDEDDDLDDEDFDDDDDEDEEFEFDEDED